MFGVPNCIKFLEETVISYVPAPRGTVAGSSVIVDLNALPPKNSTAVSSV
jgi:hypothetical protein